MTLVVRRAYGVYRQQKQRCENDNSPAWRYYGARGICVEYEAREFIGWFLHFLARNNLKKPSVGRIDHSKNYRFDNIELIEHSVNSSEANRRWGAKKLAKVVAVGPSNILLYFRCVGECARVFGVAKRLMLKNLDGKIKSPVPQWVFKYDVSPGASRKARS